MSTVLSRRVSSELSVVMASEVLGCEGRDLSRLVADLRLEVAQVRSELSVVMEEYSKLKIEMGKHQSVCVGVVDGGVGENVSVGNGVGEKWRVVKGKRRSTRLTLKKGPAEMDLSNSYSVLHDEAEGELRGKADDHSQPEGKCQSVVFVGDSHCRHVGKKVRHRVKGNFFFPGAGVKKVGESVESWIGNSKVVCLIAGGNDVQDNRSEEMIRLYRQALERVRKRGATAVLCSILPRMNQGSEWMSRAIGINDRMKAFCRDRGVVYVDAWDSFYGRKHLFARDNVHLSKSGNSRLAALIDSAIEGFC